ncbi:MAG: H-X9-DG-CTERM domain-containing protein, partial [Planctomycetota bacterium]
MTILKDQPGSYCSPTRKIRRSLTHLIHFTREITLTTGTNMEKSSSGRCITGEHDAEPMYRHSEGADVAFCDGHVEYLKKSEMLYFTDGNRPNLAAPNVDVT